MSIDRGYVKLYCICIMEWYAATKSVAVRFFKGLFFKKLILCISVCMSMCVLTHALGLWGPYSLPGFSVHEIFQARILDWVAISYFRGSSQPRDQTHVSCIGRGIFTTSTTWEALLGLGLQIPP